MAHMVHQFEDNNVQTFEKQLKFMVEVPFATFFDFEAISWKKIYNFDQDTNLYPFSYAMAIAFNPKLNLDKKFYC